MAGDLYELPGGSVQASIGVEYRKDEIKSMPDAVARDGLFLVTSPMVVLWVRKI